MAVHASNNQSACTPPTDNIPVSVSGQITIAGLPFTLIKNLTIPNELDTLEVGDVIKGFATNGDFIEAKYLGGDATDFENENVYIIYSGI